MFTLYYRNIQISVYYRNHNIRQTNDEKHTRWNIISFPMVMSPSTLVGGAFAFNFQSL